MIIEGYRRTWKVNDAPELRAALAWRDERGGGEFWLAHEGTRHPCLAICMSSDIADVHYFPVAGGSAFRRLGGENLPENGTTTMIYMGCDPGDGVETPNSFIIPSTAAVAIAEEFFRTKLVSCSAGWMEL
jgi:hypothetical protein